MSVKTSNLISGLQNDKFNETKKTENLGVVFECKGASGRTIRNVCVFAIVSFVAATSLLDLGSAENLDQAFLGHLAWPVVQQVFRWLLTRRHQLSVQHLPGSRR